MLPDEKVRETCCTALRVYGTLLSHVLEMTRAVSPMLHASYRDKNVYVRLKQMK